MHLIEAKKTNLSKGEAISLFKSFIPKFFGFDLSNESYAILLSQSSLETGNWQLMWNWNFGNKKVPKNWDGKYQMLRCSEVLQGKEVFFDPPHKQTWFVAFDSAEDGLRDHLRLLCSERYFKAYEKMIDGDREGFITELHNSGYFTASLNVYNSTHEKLYSKFMRDLLLWEFSDH